MFIGNSAQEFVIFCFAYFMLLGLQFQVTAKSKVSKSLLME